MYIENIILGAGITGISASYHLAEKGMLSVIIEKEKYYGGLCHSFSINKFIFDTFAHVNFDNNLVVKNLLESKVPCFYHPAEALNYKEGNWIKNPVQCNLFRLPIEERIKIITSYAGKAVDKPITNYEDWLKLAYGEYFALNYPAKYTRKYWTINPEHLDAKWIGNRMYVPRLEEILKGALEEGTSNVHYYKTAKYPQNGGFRSFIEPMAQTLNISLNQTISCIRPHNKVIILNNKSEIKYKNLINTIPLVELIRYLDEVPEMIVKAAEKLNYTSGIMVSIGLSKPKISPSLWFYIYDEDIEPSRVYSPDWKSNNNVPEGCSALQAEIYYSKFKPLKGSLDEIKERVIKQLLKLNLFAKEDIIFVDIRKQQYANVIFTPDIYKSREIVRNYLEDKGIICAGRFGTWDYLWTGQSLLDGRRAADIIINNETYKN